MNAMWKREQSSVMETFWDGDGEVDNLEWVVIEDLVLNDRKEPGMKRSRLIGSYPEGQGRARVMIKNNFGVFQAQLTGRCCGSVVRKY